MANPNFNKYETLVKEDSERVITDITITKQGLFYVKTKNGVEAKLYRLHKGNEKIIPLPKSVGYISVLSKGVDYNDLWIETQGWTSKKERYKYNYKTKTFENANIVPVQKYPELDDVIVEEIEVPSHDGVMVPLSIIYKKGIQMNSNHPLFILGYGAYGISMSPHFRANMLHWLSNGGVYAVAHVRGGGEKGDAWHKGGFKTTKPNTWKDFIACTEYLIHQKYTSPKKIAIWSGSAGGILIGRAITERPDLFAVAIIRVGLLNSIRLEYQPNGQNNTKEFGTVNDSTEFKALYEMDAYHHIKDGVNYPAVYLTAGLNDARVPAWQPAKFTARMQGGYGIG